MRLALSILLFLSISVSYAQYEKLLIQGDKSFEKMELNGALLKYLKAYEDTATQLVVKKLASTYYLLGEWEKAEEWYFRVFTYTTQTPQDYLDYITCLAYLKKEAKALEFLGYLKEYFPDYKIPDAFEFWLNQRFYAPCIPDKTKDAKISYCVDIDISRSVDTLNKKVKFYWEFDDGTKQAGLRFKKCFKTPGNHKIKLTSVDSSLGHARTSDTTLTVSFIEEANFRVNGNHTVGDLVNFYAFNLKEHPDYYAMAWEISDGTLHFKEAFVHRFYRPATFKITLHIFGKNSNEEIYQIACLTQNWSIKRGS
ncbi:PKD domain-containing protein [Luteibaculum oceani]|uniref:PKD domain-containing protein n=1 Tax=Luteibaculum oceani TaxID=1294296 RepID=A0A5C6UVP2_9FLAO|nr:PKD domain-containing protein [Luteibaculum oceani]TXC77039.1 hypothetical protein FRX97_09240 [Luteibaculum oceani]